jgi:TRAP transporter TAXI family solute receptor
VPADSPVQSVRDLKGRRVSVGTEGSGTLYDTRLILAGYGLKQTDVEEVFERPEPSVDLVVDGKLDAMVMTGGPPLGVITDLAKRRPMRLLPIEGADAEALVAQAPFFTLEAIPEGAYDGIPAVPTLSVGAIWLVSAKVADETVYQITRALWQDSTLALLAAGHPRGKEISAERAVRGLGVPLHPGAARYYAEHAGIGSPTRATP